MRIVEFNQAGGFLMSSADQSENNSQRTSRGSHIELSTPWGRICSAGPPKTIEEANAFIHERSVLHALFITETEKTKRLGLSLAACLLALACIIPIFAPAGREVTSYWISTSLLVFSAGSMGFTKIFLNAKELNLSGAGPRA